MNSPTPLIAFLVWLPVVFAAAAADPAPANPTPVTVMLQGGSAAELRQLVHARGGTVSHELPIIAAVGARLTPAQLELVLASPLVERHIDDLSVSRPPATPPGEATPGEATPDCDVSAAVELEFDRQGISWTLYNLQASPARLEHLELRWPAYLGSIDSIRLGPQALDPARYRNHSGGPLKLDFAADGAPELVGRQALRVVFRPGRTSTGDVTVQQRDFTVKVVFAGDCSSELIPGYEHNDEDFYYAGVAGVDALHVHGVTGKGVTVAVLDSGLWEHPALATDTAGRPRVLARYNAITDTAGREVFDESGHGTHMTSVIAHSGATTRDGTPTGSFKGIAPDVNLVAVKAFDIEGQGDLLDIVRAIQWVVDNRETYNIRVLNLSFAARPRWDYWLDPINQAVMRAWESGITVVAAAGNEGPDPMTIGSPGNLPYIITVGAVTDSWTPANRDDDYIPDFSSRGPTPNAHIKPDLVAPGGHITGLTRPGSTLTREHPGYLLRTGEFVMTGSSQASALVSGIVALLLQLEPELTPDDIKCMLITSAEPAINNDGLLAYTPFQQGHGYVSAARAITLGQRGCGNPGMDIRKEIAGQEHFRGPAIIDEEGQASLPGLNQMVSDQPAAKGASETRKWGVKAHIEREGPAPVTAIEGAGAAFNWYELYLQEKIAIEKLAGEATDETPATTGPAPAP